MFFKTSLSSFFIPNCACGNGLLGKTFPTAHRCKHGLGEGKQSSSEPERRQQHGGTQGNTKREKKTTSARNSLVFLTQTFSQRPNKSHTPSRAGKSIPWECSCGSTGCVWKKSSVGLCQELVSPWQGWWGLGRGQRAPWSLQGHFRGALLGWCSQADSAAQPRPQNV